MNTKVEAGGLRLDALKMLVATAVLGSGIGAYYYWPDKSHLVRVLGVLVAVVVAALIALQTDKGRLTWKFFQDARTEVRKVVWPTRRETVQTTMMVIGMVVLVALFLWVLDMFLGWGVGSLTGQRG